MWLLWVGVALLVLKVLEVSVFAALSWWWIVLVFALAFVWFEFFERIFGLDKKKAFDEVDNIRKQRIQRALGVGKARRR